jgi:hypothetical protein
MAEVNAKPPQEQIYLSASKPDVFHKPERHNGRRGSDADYIRPAAHPPWRC